MFVNRFPQHLLVAISTLFAKEKNFFVVLEEKTLHQIQRTESYICPLFQALALDQKLMQNQIFQATPLYP